MSADPPRLSGFYDDLGFLRRGSLHAPGGVRVELKLGDERIDLVRPATPGAPCPRFVPGWSPWFQHFAIVVSDMRQAYARLQALMDWTPISTDGPVRLPETSGGVDAFKFRDPEGHPLELIAFPADRMPERWRRRGAEAIFLGIDHSAISVADTRRSTVFYESLGMARTGASINRGVEQARLDDLVAPLVEVTALSPQKPGPHLELLCYQGNFDRGEARPRASDIAATRLVFGETATTMIYDPDGHLIVADEASSYSGST